MKRILTIALATTLILSKSIGQTNLFEIQMLKSCLIQLENGGLGTGMLYKDSTSFYLITARHNFYQEKIIKGKKTFALKTKNCKLITYPRNIKSSKSDTLSCDLIELTKSRLLKFDNSNDVATIKIARLENKDTTFQIVKYLKGVKRLDSNSTSINAFTKEEVTKVDEINIGDEIAIFGYPRAIGLQRNPQYDFNRPLLRKGSIAGINNAKRTIILDCEVFQGNSGGPVVRHYTKFEDIKNGFVRKNTSELIGIISQFIPLEEKWKNLNYGMTNIQWDNSGYSVIVPIDYALKLIETY